PDERGRGERQQRQRPEGDREQRGVAVERRIVGADGLEIERLPRIEASPGVVVSVDVDQGIGRQVEDPGLDPEDCTDDRGSDQDAADMRRLEGGADAGVRSGHRAILPVLIGRPTALASVRTSPFVPIATRRTRCYAAPAVRTPLALYL